MTTEPPVPSYPFDLYAARAEDLVNEAREFIADRLNSIIESVMPESIVQNQEWYAELHKAGMSQVAQALVERRS
jgi:hypothetical protein